ncbi:MAG: Gmad2 immunoglobulin-like domain-containing protein [Candidatus Paceibacterota bacterium]
MFNEKLNWKYILIVILIAVIAGIAVYRYKNVEQVSVPEDSSPVSTTTKGLIQGSMSYPSEQIPEDVKVCAENVATGERYCTEERLQDEKYKYGVGYQLKLPVGSYFVESIREDTGSNYQAYYSEHVNCEPKIECDSHKPLVVKVVAGEEKAGIDPIDWSNFDKTNDLAEWEIYRNEEYDFQIRHPEQWQVKKQANEVLFGEEKEGTLKTGLKVIYYKSYEDLPGGSEISSLRDWYESLQGGETMEDAKVGLEDYDATLIKNYKPLGVTKLITNYFVEDEGFYRIQSEVPSASTEDIESDFDYKQTFNYMLSTFKLRATEQREIRVEAPQSNQMISSPLAVKGEAHGSWYFEGSFPVELKDAGGNSLARKSIQAQGDWMTEDFVPFEVELSFETPQTATGTLILEKANPSGLPENVDQREIPVKFK